MDSFCQPRYCCRTCGKEFTHYYPKKPNFGPNGLFCLECEKAENERKKGGAKGSVGFVGAGGKLPPLKHEKNED